MADNLHSLKERLLKLLPRAERRETDIPGLTLSRFDADTPARQCFYVPMIALVVQGYKRAMIGGREASYGKGQVAVIGVDVPGVYQIIGTSETAPFLALSVKLDRNILSQLINSSPALIKKQAGALNPIGVSQAGEEILNAFDRLVGLLDFPERIPILAPLLLREIHFYLLESIQGECLKIFHAKGTNAYQIAQAIFWLRANYAASFPMAELARQVNMAPATFNRHFRETTGLSPLQFQKQLRLYEAERLMLYEGKDAGSAAGLTGYESASHFSRDYKRLFGRAPREDMAKKRLSNAG